MFSYFFYMALTFCSLCTKDEDVYAFFEPELPPESINLPKFKGPDQVPYFFERRSAPKFQTSRSSSKSSQQKYQRPAISPNPGAGRRPSPETERTSWNVLDLKKENYFSCAVGRTRTNARYLLNSSADVVAFMNELAEASL